MAMINEFNGRPVEVVKFYDMTAAACVIEFRDHENFGGDSLIAISVGDGGGVADAIVSTNPDIPGVSLNFMIWAIDTARALLFPP